MRYFESLAEIPDDAFPNGTAVAIGKFDGVHRGHQALIARICAAAEAEGLEPIILTFVDNPQRRLHPELAVRRIMSRDQRLEALKNAGIQACVMVPFDDDFAAITAEGFVEDVLVKQLRAREVSVGRDFRFGSGGFGDVDFLAELGRRLGFAVEVIPVVEDPELGRISSSGVREAILQGDVAIASRMLGYPVELRATVVHGDARGRDLGFPTANLGDGVEGLVPADGVYAGWALIGDERIAAAISVGNNPTFTPDAEPRVEAYLLDFDRDVYGERITLQFVERLRGNIVFTGIDPLIEQMHADVAEARRILTSP